MDSIASSLPVEMIYSDFSTHPREIQQSQVPEEIVVEKLKTLKNGLVKGTGTTAEAFREVMRSTRLFDTHMEIAERFIREEF